MNYLVIKAGYLKKLSEVEEAQPNYLSTAIEITPREIQKLKTELHNIIAVHSGKT
jgi:hypothetical protein